MQFTVKEMRRENSMIVLDTDILIEIFDKGSTRGEEILEKIEGYEIATTSITLHEIVYGCSMFER